MLNKNSEKCTDVSKSTLCMCIFRKIECYKDTFSELNIKKKKHFDEFNVFIKYILLNIHCLKFQFVLN